MKLTLAEKWINETFEGESKPSIDKVKSWVLEEEIPGRVIGNFTYVDADRFAFCDKPVYREQTETLTAVALLE